MLILKGQSYKLPTIQHILNETDSICIMYDHGKPAFGHFYVDSSEMDFDEFIRGLDEFINVQVEERAGDGWDYIIIYTNEYEQNFHVYESELSKLDKYCVCLIVTCAE